MSKSRRKSNGCRRGAFKPKRMGKGWLTDHQPKRKVPPPNAKKAGADGDEAESETGSS